MKYQLLLVFSLLIVLAFSAQRYYVDPEWTLKTVGGEEIKEFSTDPLYVHMIPHTHDDVGWLKTVDQYFYGNKNSINWAAVSYIIDSVVNELQKDVTRHFIYVETAFFYRWYKEQTNLKKAQVQKLVENGQLEFINGGWCMNDEATCYYEDIIDQMTLGHQFLLNNFGVVPTIGWQIDPFGHSASMAALFGNMGFNAWFFARVDYLDKQQRLNDKTLEMISFPRQDSKDSNYIFTHVLYNHYEAPPNFNFDTKCTDDPIMDDPTLEYYNLKSKADDLVNYFRTMEQHYKSNQLMHTFGSDFQWTDAGIWYKNLDKLITYINQHPETYNNVTFLYSTPSIYLKYLNNQKSLVWPTKTDDFFPYSDNPNGFWAGYFTSRVAEKGFVRDTNRYLQSMRTYLSQLRFIDQSPYVKMNEQLFFDAIFVIESAMGINQHHDGLTGTEKQAVANDYSLLLANATLSLNSFLFPVLQEQVQMDINENLNFYHYNWNNSATEWNVAYDSLVNNKPVVLTVYNPGVQREEILKIKVPQVKFNVLDINNNILTADIICANHTDLNDCDLFFAASLKNYSLNYFKLVPSQQGQSKVIVSKSLSLFSFSKTFTLSNKASLLTHRYSNKFKYTTTSGAKNFQLHFNYYKSFQEINGQKSGAYIFRPQSIATHKHSKLYSPVLSKEIFIGQIVSVLHLNGLHIDTQIRFNSQDQDFIEIENHVKSIPIHDDQGKEIVMLYDFQDISNGDIWYTDANGLETQQRKLNYRPTYTVDLQEPAAGNYYPINMFSYIEDPKTNKRVAVLTDRSCGGSSLKEGQIEIMIHRRLVRDDSRGVGEPLNELNTYNSEGLEQKVRHWIVFYDNNVNILKPRQYQKSTDQVPVTFVSQSSTNTFSNAHTGPTIFQGTLQSNMKYYIKYMGQNQYILRLHNLNELQIETFQGTFSSLQEYTLTANQLLSDWENKRMTWNYATEDEQKQTKQQDQPEIRKIGQQYQIDVKQSSIRTFIVSP